MKLVLLFMISAVFPLVGQIAQSHPEFCGIPGGINPQLPPDVSATVTDDEAVLHIRRGTTDAVVPLVLGTLPSMISEIAEICPLADGRLVVFGKATWATNVYLVDQTKAVQLDSFTASNPVLSPDQRWIAYAKFYPAQVEGSSEYMIYDLAKTLVQNRPDGAEPTDTIDVGRVIFPPGHQNFPGSNTNLPDELRHFGAGRLYWAPDGRAILFEDRTPSDAGIVLVAIDEKGTPAASRHTLSATEICGRETPDGSTYNWKLDRVDVGPGAAGSRAILVDLSATGGDRCTPHVLQLRSEDFKAAKVEENVKPAYSRGAVVDGKEVIPPKKKK
ncbi:MAG: hypothetical protein JWQ49_6234 [Edaphobacter sp.]|nr:hypothetical protein [Edaphobacter sp.]